jgi:hypothetical protein
MSHPVSPTSHRHRMCLAPEPLLDAAEHDRPKGKYQLKAGDRR